MHELQDQEQYWVIFEHLFGGVRIPLPNIFGRPITKFMILELVVAGLIAWIYIRLARRIEGGGLPRGRWWNFWETLLTFVRNDIVRPNFGKHSDSFVPYFWTLFLFLLICNLLGLIPFLGSPTVSIWVTGALALCSFGLMHGVPIARVGLPQYLKSLWPPLPWPLFPISLMIAVIELIGTVIKSGVLAIRLFANMFAGHMVLAIILGFTFATTFSLAWLGVTTISVLGVVALSLLELFVAFLQAYVFTFLTAIFVGMALDHAEHAGHPEHEAHEHEPHPEPVILP
jgi:F-type H+-transporting ATPase subunit a